LKSQPVPFDNFQNYDSQYNPVSLTGKKTVSASSTICFSIVTGANLRIVHKHTIVTANDTD